MTDQDASAGAVESTEEVAIGDPVGSERAMGDRSRRNFMKASALAAGGLALGATAAEGAAAQSESMALVYAYEFHPVTNFRVVDTIRASSTVRLLRLADGSRVSEISQPDDYNGYIIRYELGDPRSAVTTFLFTRATLQRGQAYRMSGIAQLFSTDLNLIGARIDRRNDGN